MSSDQAALTTSTTTMQSISGLCVISVKSTWQSAKNKKDISIQTQHLSTMESGVQTQSAGTAEDEAHRMNACEGTDDRVAVPSASPAGSGWAYTGDHYDEHEVATFLSSIHADLARELKQLSKSSAFDNYEPGWKEKSTVGAKLVKTFPSVVFLDGGKNQGGGGMTSASSNSSAGSSSNQQPLQVTGISWNASGALVAAAYGRVDSYTWSTGNGFVAVWPAAAPVVTATAASSSGADGEGVGVGGVGASVGTGVGSGAGKEYDGGAAADGGRSSKKKSSSSKTDRGSASVASPLLAGGNGNSDAKTEVEGPLILLETDAFATCVAFHPTVPTLVAAATFSGEILLWDISSTDDASASSVKPLCSNFGSHQQGGQSSSSSSSPTSSSIAAAGNSTTSASVTNKDPINKLVWIQNPREPRESHKYLLCSAASDGTIAFWTPGNKFAEPVGLGTLQNRRRATLGVQSLAFLSTAISSSGGASAGGGGSSAAGKRIPTQEAPMVMATDSGDVVRGKVPPKATVIPTTASASKATASTASAKTSPQQQQAVPLNNTEFFESHSGPTNAIDASPFFRNIFLTCSSDGSIRLYSLLDMQHKLALVPSPDTKHFLYSASFSPIRPGVIATCSRSSQIHIFDLTESRVKPAFTIDRAGTEDSAVLCLGWSSHGSSFATGDAKGCIRIWSVASSLCETTELERFAIRHAEKQQKQQQQQGASSSPSKQKTQQLDGGEAESKFDIALTQSMLIAGKGDAAGSGGNHADPVQMLFGFTP